MTTSSNLLNTVAGLRLSHRAHKCCMLDNMIYVGDLAQKTRAEVLALPNAGKKTAQEIEAALAEVGLTLGMDLPNWPPVNLDAELTALAA